VTSHRRKQIKYLKWVRRKNRLLSREYVHAILGYVPRGFDHALFADGYDFFGYGRVYLTPHYLEIKINPPLIGVLSDG